MPDYSIRVNGKDQPRNKKQQYENGTIAPELATFQSYESYFGGNYSLVEYDNQIDNSGSNLLIIGDSFTQPIEPMLAASYDKTYVIDPRTKYFTDSISDFIDSHDIEDVVVVMRITTMVEDGVADELES